MNKSVFFNGNVIDIEASGLDPKSYPIELGIVLGSGRTFEALIKPIKQWNYWSDEAEAIHGISRERIEREGQSVRDVCLALNAFCEGEILYSDAWTLDNKWLKDLFQAANMEPSFTCSPIDYFVSEYHILHWRSYKEVYAKSLNMREHRALNDAKIIAQIVSEEGQQFVIDTVSDNFYNIQKSA